jgi:short-subunit dehydrogenase
MNDVGSTESSKSSLEGKTAVITGASSGIGAALARMLHERGVNLGLASRSGDDLGLDGVVAQPCDVRDLDELVSICDPTVRGLPNEVVYCGSKFGQVGFTAAMDHELRAQGIRCTNVCPGGVATDFALDEGRGRRPDALRSAR